MSIRSASVQSRWWVAGGLCAAWMAGFFQMSGVAQAEPKTSKAANAGQHNAATKDTPAARAAPSSTQEKVIYTFQDDNSLQQFTELWQQRQGILVRLSVLQAYLSEEQAGLEELNEKVSSAYHMNMDALGNYVLDTDRKLIVERPGAPAAAPASPAPTAPAAQP